MSFSKFGSLSSQAKNKVKSTYVGKTGLIYKQRTFKNKEGIDVITWQARLELDHGNVVLLTITPEVKNGGTDEAVIFGNAALFTLQAD